MDEASLTRRLSAALEARSSLFDDRRQAAFRLFNGFTEGCPGLTADLYGATLLLQEHCAGQGEGERLASLAQAFYLGQLPWLRAALFKSRSGGTEAARRGRLVHGHAPDRQVREHGVSYALDLSLNRDASLYLDTRNLRRWAIERLAGKTVLNTFAYTGSLGVAALAGGASRVVHLDLNRAFLDLAKASYGLNGFPVDKGDFLAGDFFPLAGRLKRRGARFDCVFLDPPFFSSTSKGSLDLATDSVRLVNKVRPLAADGGWIAAVNNAVYLGGREYFASLDALCGDGYLEIESLIPVPPDFTGFPETTEGVPITDPAPFNHSTKIAILRVRRK
ncbi:MAG: class I SAM-dependent rRNA methyltransferase [Chloroflexi bacterium]|nr:class I SAM-dependent rRNA methyltransferase [Chloroflexota bacterium]